MKKLIGAILAFALFLPSMGCGWGPWDYAGPLSGYGYRGRGYGYGYPGRYPYRNYDYDRYGDSDNNNDDAAVLGAVLGTAAIIGTVIAIDAIRNQPAPESTPPPPPRFNP
ncbi:MAG: hypothetical protein ACM3TN_19005 [Alphaproteobacteria bacterium]